MDREVSGPLRRRWSDDSTPASVSDKPWSMADQWPVVVGALAGDQHEAMRVVEDHVQRARAEGRMDEAEAQSLRRALADLRHTTQRAQQITRLAGGRIRQYRESIDLAQVVRAVLRDKGARASLPEAVGQASLAPVDLFMDAASAYAIVEGVLAWMLARCSDIVVRTECTSAGEGATFVASGRRRAEDPAPGALRRRRLEDGLDLVLVRQAVVSAGLALVIRDDGGQVGLSVHFPQAFTDIKTIEGHSFGRGPAPHVVPDWVLVVTTDEGLVSSAAFGLGQAGFETRGARSAREARAKLRQSPVAVILDSAATGPDFDDLRSELLVVGGSRPLIEITRGAAPDAPQACTRDCPRVPREDVVPDIAATLLFELTKTS